jgi:hypothetical protein
MFEQASELVDGVETKLDKLQAICEHVFWIFGSQRPN